MHTNRNLSLTGNHRSAMKTWPPPTNGGTNPSTAYDNKAVV